MSSATAAAHDDLTTEARIRNVALRLFGQRGPAAVSVRAVAAEAGVSAALVIHHFGSKAGLIDAVDDYFLARVIHHMDELQSKTDPEEAKSVMVALTREPDLFTYLARSLAEGGDAGAHLFDRLFAVTTDILDAMIDAGFARPVADRDALAALLLAEDLGMMMLRHHFARAIGIDPYESEGMDRLAAVDLEIKTNPLITFPAGETP